MIFAEVEVSGICARTAWKRPIPAGIVGAQVSFTFTDPKWDELNKTVVFKGFGTKDAMLEGNTLRIPQEVVSRKDVRLRVGVYGTDAEKRIAIPTLWADLGTVRDAADPSGDPATDPELPIWATLQAEIDQLKENGATDEQIATAIEKYLEKNPINCLPEVSEADEGKILRVIGGKWGTAELPVYSGEYAVTPTVDGQTLQTAQKYMTQNVNVKKIPYYEVDNTAGGTTIYIGTDDEVVIE